MIWRKKRRRKEPSPVGELVWRYLQQRGTAKEMRLATLILRWPELVGEALAGRTLPAALKEGQLTIEVPTSAWLNELSLMRADLVTQINDGLGRKEVSSIRLTLRPAARRRKRSPHATRVDLGSVDLPQGCVEEVKRLTEASSSDPQLRRAMASARLAQIKRSRLPR